MQGIIRAIQRSVIRISEELKYADFGYLGTQNSTGDTQLKLDVKSDEIITEELSKLVQIKSLISEEKTEALEVCENGKYIIAYDPLDGSSLVDVNFSVGSIFGIYKNELKTENLIAAVYCVYGPRLEMVICESAPKLYRLAKDGEFKFIKNLVLEEKGKLNASGGTQKDWNQDHAKLIKSFFDEGYRLRYSGAMVSDLHQILLKGGGIFSYPATKNSPNGKLRMAFEVLPFAIIFERAKGATTNGKNKSLLELELTQNHQTTPCYFGSIYEINKVLGK